MHTNTCRWYEIKPKIARFTWDTNQSFEEILDQPPVVLDWRESWTPKSVTEPTNNKMFTETKTTKTTTEKKSPFVFEEGGPVHPCTYGNIHDGMSLRDYFAGQALTGITSIPTKFTSIVIANQCYLLADAMLKARTLKSE